MYDDINQLIELIESYQDTVNSNRELYIVNASVQMSDTVKTLTIFSAILLPLTFISSVYGMNGLDVNNIWSIPVGFAILILVVTMGAVAFAVLFLFFKKKAGIMVADKEATEELEKEESKKRRRRRKGQ